MSQNVKDVFQLSALGPRFTRRLYGIEIEVEGYDGVPEADEAEEWHLETDGSLRDNGVEFISPPSTSEELAPMIRTFYQWDRAEGYVHSLRTSTHVHVNAQPYTLRQLGGIAAIYALVEPLLFDFLGEEREENIYCVPWYRAPGEVELVARLTQAPDDRGSLARGLVGRLCKYSALYMGPLRNFGTVEFRGAPVLPGAGALLEWISMCGNVVDIGARLGGAEEVLLEHRRRGTRALAAMVMGPLNLPDNVDELVETHDSISVAELLVDGADEYLFDSWAMA